METNERNTVIYALANSIATPLAFGSEELYKALCEGRSVAQLHENAFGLPEPFFGSLFNRQWIDDTFASRCRNEIRYTPFEKIALLTASDAIGKAGINPASERVLFVVSTTKGNVHLLENDEGYEPQRVYLWRSAQLIAQYFGNHNTPLVVSNACISGVSAQLTAAEFLRGGNYDYAVVVGAETLSKFVISGFQSFKALSQDRCKPFDKDRVGLNLGEGAACIVFGTTDDTSALPQGTPIFCNGASCNDANHISGPSRTGEGLHNAIEKTFAGFDKSDVAFINAHGTATPYNDDMESWAIFRSELSQTPVNSLKGYLGHTLGAAGILETIISSIALKNRTILPTLGHENFGVVQPVTVCTQKQTAQGNSFLKLISGFGGSNAAILFRVK